MSNLALKTVDGIVVDELGPDPWERQKGESRQAFAAFAAYRDQSPKRSLRQIAKALDKSSSLIARWSSHWFWQRRVDAWDAFQDERKRFAQLEVIEEMSRRHAQTVSAAITVHSLPIKETLKRFQMDERALEMMELEDIIKLALVSAKNLPSLVQSERLTRGASTENVEQHIQEKRETKIVIDWNDDWRPK